jgi:hypothetical protein
MIESHLHPIVFEDIESVIASNLDWNRFKNKTVLISGVYGFLAS